MPIFGDPSSPYDEIVEKVTAETATSENWTLMFDICDRVSSEGPRACKQCLLSVKKRLNHRDPHVVLLALSLLDCLWNNCGPHFRREVSSKDFVGEISYKCTNSNRVIAERSRSLVKKWCENECKKDSSLSLIESLYKDLLDQGYNFDSDPTIQKKKAMVSSDPNVVSSEQEEADIAKAIELSLQESGVKQHSNNSYPVLRNSNSNASQNEYSNTQNRQTIKQVRALYDFEAAEDNELSFLAGELINVFDDSDQNWWRGSTGRGALGLFPASFVTADLTIEPVSGECALQNGTNRSDIETVMHQQPKVQIDEDVLLKCIQLLESCDPALDPSTDPAELPILEQMSKAQAPLIDQKLVQFDKQLSMLAEVDIAIREVLTAYDTAVQQVTIPSTMQIAPTPMSYAPTSIPPSSIPVTQQTTPGTTPYPSTTVTQTHFQQTISAANGVHQWQQQHPQMQ